MEALFSTSCENLGALPGLHCLPRKPPIYRFGGTSTGIYTLLLQMGTCCSPQTQLNSRKCKVRLSSVNDLTILLKIAVKPLSHGVRGTWSRPTGCPQRKRLFLDDRVNTASRFGLLQTRCNTKNFPLATTGEGSSGTAKDSTLGEDEAVHVAIDSSPGSSFLYPWLSRLKDVDWNKLIFNCRKNEKIWTVPWTVQTIFQVMMLWFAAFWVMGSWVLPISAQFAGFSRHSLTFRGQAFYSLITDISEGTVGILILKRCLARFLPLPEGWFPVKLQGSWLLEASWGCILFPLVNRLSKLNLYLVPLPPLTTSAVEQSMLSRDPVATLLYATVISVCAPVWEEVIFRGFLLPSMTRYMPVSGAIFVSALAFALAHFSMQRVLPLTFLGLVMGFVFVRSKNLLASIVLHSLWNGFAFLELL